MKNVSISPEIYDIYGKEDYTPDDEWSLVSAKYKVHNIYQGTRGICHDTILDVGAGSGSVLKLLDIAKFGRAYYALEISEPRIRSIEDRNISQLKEVKYFDGYSIPYEDDSFDLAILSHVLEHVEHPRVLLAEIARVARHFYIEVPLEHTVTIDKHFSFNSVGHINYWSMNSFIKTMKTCSYDVVGHSITLPGLDVHLAHGNRIKGAVKYYIKWLTRALLGDRASSIFHYHGYVVARKA